MSSKGNVSVISGFSGTGKGTIMKNLVTKYEGYALSVSMTTRDPRPGEIPDVTYHYVTDRQFEQLIEEDGFLEHAGYVGHYYGTPKKFVTDAVAEGKKVLLEIEVQGGMQIKAQLPEAKLLFVVTPSAAELERRLVSRGSETPQVVTGRLARAIDEIEFIKKYDYLVVNDDLDEATAQIVAITSDEPVARMGQQEQEAFLDQFRADLQSIVERRRAQGLGEEK